MATLEKNVNFSGKNWGGYCRVTYTAQDGTISITKLEFKATNSTSAGYGAYYSNSQSRSFTCGGSSITASVNKVEIKQTSYVNANLSKTLTYTGITGSSATFTFTVQARASSPNTLTFNFDIPMTFSTYTVSYNANGGSSTPSNQTKTYGSNLTLASAISRNSTTANGYTVNFNANGGSVSPTSKVATDTTSYSFNSWKATNGTTYSAGGTYSANEGTTMTAQWNSSTSKGAIGTPAASRASETYTRTVVFNGNGGNNQSSQTSKMTRTFTSNGWFESTSGGTAVASNGGSYTPSTNNKTLYSQWKQTDSSYSSITLPSTTRANGTSTHTIAFNVNGGVTPAPSSQTSTATITYSFAGWYTAASGGTQVSSPYTPSTSPVNLYAHWNTSYSNYSSITLPNATKNATSETRTVTFNANGGTCSTNSLTSTKITTYTLKGWFTAASGGSPKGTAGQTYTNPDAGTLYAQWNSNPGNFSSITLPNATREGYVFKGWNTDSTATNGSIGTYIPTGSYTMYAIWEEDRPDSVTMTITNIGRTAIRFTCSCIGVTNPIFTLHYIPEGGTEQTYRVTGSGTSRTDIVRGLTPGTLYSLYMQAQNSVQTLSNTSASVSCTTLADIPKNLTLNISDVKYTSAQVNCSAIGDTNANIINYKVYWRTKPSKPIYDMAIKTLLSDGSCWARIFYHNNMDGTVLFSTVEECRNVQTENKYSRLYLLDDNTYKRNDGKFEFMLTYPGYSNEYNRWKQSESPCDTYTGTGAGSTVSGYEANYTSWKGSDWGGLERNSADRTQINRTYIDGSVGFGNWWYSIGPVENYPGTAGIGIPGPNSQIITGPVELWVRIDDGTVYSKDLGTSSSGIIDTLKDYTKYIFFFSCSNKAGTSWSSAINIETYKDNATNIMVKNGWTYNDYEKLDYIESSAIQWIDSEINPYNYNSHLNIEADIEFTSTTGAWSSGWQTIVGASYGNYDQIWYWHPEFHLAVNDTNNFVIEYPCSNDPTVTHYNSISSDSVAGTTRHKVSVLIQENSQSLKVDGFIKEKIAAAYGGPDCNLYIFARNYVEPSSTYPRGDTAANLKLYHLTIIDTATQSVLKNFFPCKRKSDNKLGLYDVINDKFHTNLNDQSDFIAGNTEIWNKGSILYKQDGAWKRVKNIYIKNNGIWKKAQQ